MVSMVAARPIPVSHASGQTTCVNIVIYYDPRLHGAPRVLSACAGANVSRTPLIYDVHVLAGEKKPYLACCPTYLND